MCRPSAEVATACSVWSSTGETASGRTAIEANMALYADSATLLTQLGVLPWRREPASGATRERVPRASLSALRSAVPSPAEERLASVGLGAYRGEEAQVARLRRSVLLGSAIAAAVAVAGCADATSSRDQSAAEIYAAVIRWIVADDADGDVAAERTVFVEAAGEERIALAVQADVVGRLEGSVEIRFIDTREEAIDTSEPADPVRDGGVLVGLGPLRDLERASVRVYADRYRDLRDVAAYEIVLERSDQTWRVSGDPTRVDVDDADRVLGD